MNTNQTIHVFVQNDMISWTLKLFGKKFNVHGAQQNDLFRCFMEIRQTKHISNLVCT